MKNHVTSQNQQIDLNPTTTSRKYFPGEKLPNFWANLGQIQGDSDDTTQLYHIGIPINQPRLNDISYEPMMEKLS